MQSLVESLDASQASSKIVNIPQSILTEDLGDVDTQAAKLVLDFVETENYDGIAALIDALMFLSQHEKCAPAAAHQALETTVETLSLNKLPNICPYVETRWLKLVSGVEANRGPGITVLRTLKSLLKRLSVVSDSKSVTRIVNCLSESFAFPARATVNSKSVSVAPPIPAWDRENSDRTYILFWQSMQDLQDVRALYKSSETVSQCLKRLRELAKVLLAAEREITSPIKDLMWNTDPLVLPSLVNSQTVQRVVALQVMIAIEAMLEQRKKEHDRLVRSSSNKGALDDYVLSEQQEKDVLQLKSVWFTVLRETCTKSQLQYIQRFFMGEKDWVLWKHTNMPGSFPPLTGIDTSAPEPRAFSPTPTPQVEYAMVTAGLTELWKVEPSLEIAFSSLKQTTNTDYVSKYKVAAEEHPENKYIYRWLALNNTLDADITAAEVGADYLEPGAARDVIDALRRAVFEPDAKPPTPAPETPSRGEKRSHPDSDAESGPSDSDSAGSESDSDSGDQPVEPDQATEEPMPDAEAEPASK